MPLELYEMTLSPCNPSLLFVKAALIGFCCNGGVLANTWTLGPAFFSFLCICEALLFLKLHTQKNVYSFPFSSGRLESVLVLYCGGRRKRLGAEKAFYPTID